MIKHRKIKCKFLDFSSSASQCVMPGKEKSAFLGFPQHIVFQIFLWKKYWKSFLLCHSVLWYEKWPLDRFCISFSLIQACAVMWSEFFSPSLLMHSADLRSVQSFPALNIRHKVSTRKVASTSIYEELDLVTLKHSYWFLFLFNKTYFHKRWKGDGAKIFSNGENSSWLTHQYWYWNGSVKQNMLCIVYSDTSEVGIAK